MSKETRYVKDPFMGKGKIQTYGLFGLLGVIATLCYYRAIDIGRHSIMADIAKIVLDDGNGIIIGDTDCKTGKHRHVRLMPEDIEEEV